MSPERALPPENILDEANKIKERLLDIEAQAQAAAAAVREELIANAREEMGYAPLEAVDTSDLVDVRIQGKTPVVPPESLVEFLGQSHKSAQTVRENRQAVEAIIKHESDRYIVIVGPCSIHDPEAALAYAGEVKKWRDTYGQDLEIMMRAYMEKPRSEKDWKGFVYDPYINQKDDINEGVIATRMIASQITHSGVPIAMERLNALTPQYVNGLVGYDAIGARNAEDQKAREYGSGTSSSVGFKNNPEGDVNVAVSAAVSASSPHSFLGISMNGMPADVKTKGNGTAHVILRGGKSAPNYDELTIHATADKLLAKGCVPSLIVDASHGNSGKKANRQMKVIQEVSRQVALGSTAICGVMIESNLVGGTQTLKREDGSWKNKSELIKGQSITDECVGLDTTEQMLQLLASAVQKRRTIIAT